MEDKRFRFYINKNTVDFYEVSNCNTCFVTLEFPRYNKSGQLGDPNRCGFIMYGGSDKCFILGTHLIKGKEGTIFESELKLYCKLAELRIDIPSEVLQAFFYLIKKLKQERSN